MTGGVERAFALSPLQEGMLYHDLRDPGSGLYHGQTTAVLEGPFDEARFRRAWASAVARHEAFRTLLAWERRTRPVQVVLRRAELPIRVLDWSGLPDQERDRRWQSLQEEDRLRPFALDQAPMMRLVVAREAEATHRLLWSTHHAVLDGWSALVVLGEILADYDAMERGGAVERAPTPSFAEFVGWLDALDEPAAERFWRQELDGFRGPTPLPVPEGSTSTARQTARLEGSPDEGAAVRGGAARMRVTLNTLAIAAWALLLARAARQSDVLFGMTLSERPPEIPNIESAAGLYLSTVPVRVRIDEAEPVGAWLQDLQCRLSDARAHAAPGLANIRRWGGVGGSALLRSLVVSERFPEAVAEGMQRSSLRPRAVSVAGPSDLPLALLVHESEGIALELVHDPAAVDEEAADGLLREVRRLLVELAADGNRSLAEVGRSSLGDDPGEGPPAQAAADVLARFQEQARAHPDAVALRTSLDEYSYAELAQVARGVALQIRAAGGVPGDRVGILADRTPAAVAAMLGALEAGCAYVPLDPQLPPRRLALMAGATKWVLAEAQYADMAESTERPVLELGWTIDAEAGPLDPIDQGPEVTDRAAYVIFTSGSTGEPKGVVVGRRELAWSTGARFQSYPEAPGTFLLLSPLTVDSSVAGLYWTLCAGGTLVLPETRAEQDPDALARLIEGSGTTHVLLLPSLYRIVLEHIEARRLQTLRWVAVAGERCPPDVVRSHRESLPHVALFNEYGPSEATVWATVDEIAADAGGDVTIGRPLPGVRIRILRPDARDEMPLGEPGEICIGGAGLAQGYLDRPDLTAERFVPDTRQPQLRLYRTGDRGRWRSDGRLEFLGRLDGQVKVRGFRVERSEIERALEAHPGIAEAAVVVAGESIATRAATDETIDANTLVDALLAHGDDDRERLLRDIERSGP